MDAAKHIEPHTLTITPFIIWTPLGPHSNKEGDSPKETLHEEVDGLQVLISTWTLCPRKI